MLYSQFYGDTVRKREYQAIRQLMKDDPDTVQSMLTPKQLATAELYYGQQMTMYDAADVLGVNVSTVSRSVSSIRNRLCHITKYRYGGSDGDC